jgi:HEAT repeat protein
MSRKSLVVLLFALPSFLVGVILLFNELWLYAILAFSGAIPAILNWKQNHSVLIVLAILSAVFNSLLLALMFVTPYDPFSIAIADKMNSDYVELRSRIEASPPDERALLELVHHLDSINARKRSGAAGQLGWLALKADRDNPALAILLEKHAVPALIRVLRDSDPFVRHAAAEAFSEFGPRAREAVPALVEALKEGNTSTAWNSAEALGNIGPDASEAVPALIIALKSDFPEHAMLRKYAAEALGNIGPNARVSIPDLHNALRESDTELRDSAAEALKKIQRTP